MRDRFDTATAMGTFPEEFKTCRGFSQWNPGMTSRNHQSIVQILIDGRDQGSTDITGNPLPTLVYMAREKSPLHHHNFKAGAMNSLIRVSSEISNAPIILNVDCDMYSNNSASIREALCFFLDERGQEIAYVQYPQYFMNCTENDIYGNSFKVINEVELSGFNNFGGPLYIGTGCFHRRETLCGRIYSRDYKEDWRRGFESKGESACALEERASALTTCTYENKTQWGKEVSSPWFLPFAYVILAKNAYSLAESLVCGDTLIGWWNLQRMWLLKRLTSYLYGFTDAILKLLGFSSLSFTITSKVTEEDVSRRYEQEVMEFGSASSMFVIIAAVAMLNAVCLVAGVKKQVVDHEGMQGLQVFSLQLLLCASVVAVNVPVYEGLFLRKDKGRIPLSVTYASLGLAMVACLISHII